jgi:FkbM family methyltransferase
MIGVEDGQALKGSISYRLYQNLLRSSQAANDEAQSLYTRFVRRAITIAVLGLKRWHHIEFPARGTGGWWWIWRWRFECLMRWFEWESVVWTRRLVRPGMIVVDIGANFGYYSRILSELVGPRGVVFAFEPNPENVAVLTHNLKSRKYSNVRPVAAAISDKNRDAPLYVSPGHSNHSLISGFTETEKTIQVQSMTLDTFLSAQGINKVDFMKIDIEGGEPLALAGMQETVRNSPDLAFLIECNPRALRAGSSSPEAIMRQISDLGLEPKAILPDCSLATVPDESAIDLYINLLCRRPSGIRVEVSR